VSLNLDKSAWKCVAFGEVIANVTDRVDNPSEAGVDRYVGLEHLDPGVMTVQRWDAPDRVEAQKLRFLPGDVIFGRRRAYQKKVAQADFEGICSAHALVLRARPGCIDPSFLPAFLSSDYFIDRAIAISVGSLSPTVNWGDLKVQKFALPPLDEQKRIADLLWALERHLQTQAMVRTMLDRLVSDFCLTTYLALSANNPHIPITDVADLRMGRQKSPKYATGQHSTPYLRVANVGTLQLDLDEVEKMDFDQADREKFRLLPGDVLLTEGDIVSAMNVGRPALFTGEITGVCFQNTLIRLRPNQGTDPRYLLALCEGLRLAGVFANAASTTTVTHLGLGRLATLTVPAADSHIQHRIAILLDHLLSARALLRRSRASLAALRSSLLTDIFGGAS
jgi:type I restriction enzyme S subunit